MNFEQSSEFKKELKKLQKKWRSLSDDLAAAQLQITDLYIPQEKNDKPGLTEYRAAFFNGKRATILQVTEDGREVVKMRLDVADLGTASKVRVIFIAIRSASEVLFVEIFTKADKPREDVWRIQKYLQ